MKRRDQSPRARSSTVLLMASLLSVATIPGCGGGSGSATAPAPAPAPPPPPPAPPPPAELNLAAPTLYDIAATNHKVPFGNGTGVHIGDDGRVLAVFTVNQRIQVLQRLRGQAPTTATLPYFSADMALGVDGEMSVLITTSLTNRRMLTLTSTDFGATWSSPVDVGDAGVGPTVPAACVWQDTAGAHALVAWVAPPQQEDGGPMYVARWDATTGWSAAVRVGTGSAYTAPSLACSEAKQELIARSDLSAGINQIVRFNLDASGQWVGGGVIIDRGADPHYCVAGDDAWVGYHVTGSAMVGHSRAGAAFSSTELDASGKFVPVSCLSGGHAVVCNGDWDSKADAESKAPGRRILCHATHDAGGRWTEFSPAPGQTEQQVTSVALSPGGLAIFWQQDAGVRLAIYDWR